VLSACAAGSGERNGPGNPQSLVRAFLRAGSREVVASFWNLDASATGALMRAFYANVLSGAPAAESLRLAEAAVRSREGYTHPYYWAGPQVFSGN
jgi:CHAT domain-containing protein